MLDEYLWSEEKRAKAEAIRAEAEHAWIDVKVIADEAAIELERITELPLDKNQARRTREQVRKLRRTLRTIDRLLRWPMTDRRDPIMELMADARKTKDENELREAHIAIGTRAEAMDRPGLTVKEWMIGLSIAAAIVVFGLILFN